MSDGWGRASAVLTFLVVVLLFSGIGYFAYKSEQDFKKQCVAAAGRALYDNDGDLECYVDGIEIAEHGENSPK
jgi:hypothetical protein